MTPEQQARDLLERMEMVTAESTCGCASTSPQSMSSGELVELANLIAERDALKAALGEALAMFADVEISEPQWRRYVELRKLVRP